MLFRSWQYTKPRKVVNTIQTVLVQQNGDSWLSQGDSPLIRVSQKLSELGYNESIKKTGTTPDLIVWSESVLSYPYPDAHFYYEVNPPQEGLYPFIRRLGVPFLIGSPVTVDKENDLFSNSVLYFDKDADYQGYYGKIKLVPFAELIPGVQYQWVRNLLEKLVGFSSGWTPGTTLQLFEIPLKDGTVAKISTPICFEDAFPFVCNALHKAGSQVFFNLTNDSWSKTRSAEYQHFVIASFRAIENRTTLVRSTNSGYTVVVNPVGKVIADLPLFKQDYLYTEVPVFEKATTLYGFLGDWLPVLCSVLVVWTIFKKELKK